MAPLIYLCLMCVLIYCSRGLGEVNMIYLQVLRASFLGSGTEKWICQYVNRLILNPVNSLNPDKGFCQPCTRRYTRRSVALHSVIPDTYWVRLRFHRPCL